MITTHEMARRLLALPDTELDADDFIEEIEDEIEEAKEAGLL